jgi:hypothetical protein
MRIIRITEADLTKIVKTVIKEQGFQLMPYAYQYNQDNPANKTKQTKQTAPAKENINPKNLKVGAGGTNNPDQVADVKRLQQKLIDLGLLDIKSPSGYFGDKTQQALDAYSKSGTTGAASGAAAGASTGSSSTTQDLPFKTKEEGNAFRKWLNDNYSSIAKSFELNREGSHTNAYIKNAFNAIVPKTSTTWGQLYLRQTGGKVSGAAGGTSTGASTSTPPKEEQGFFKTLVNNVVDKAKNLLINSETLPLHIRAFANFLKLRKNPLTINDLTSTEREALKQMVDYAQKKGMIRNGKTVNFYGIANSLNDGSEKIDFKDKTLGVNQTDLKSEYTKIAMTIGNAVVNKTGDKYTVKDIYDFNNYANNPQKYTLDQTPKTVTDAVKKISNGNYVQGIEELASYYQKLGYSGYPVELEV